MPGRAEAGAFTALMRALLLLALLALAGPALGQSGEAGQAAADDSPAARIDKLIADPDTTTAELEVMREGLARQRDEALAKQKELQPGLDEINAIITDAGISVEYREGLQRLGIEVIIAGDG